MRTIYRILTLLFIVFLISCNDDDQSLNKVVVDNIVYHEDADQIGKFVYHADGKIQAYQYYVDDVMVTYDEYIYTNDKLTAKNYFTLTNEGYKLTDTDTYLYGSDGKLSQYLRLKNKPMETLYTLTWDGDHVVRMDYQYYSIATLIKGYYEIEYDSKGNAVKITAYFFDGDTPLPNYTSEIEYDDKVNPLVDFYEAYDFTLKSPNNVLKITSTNSSTFNVFSTTVYDYEYNEFDLPAMKKETIDSNGDHSEAEHKIFYRKL